jgi:hypothetical protein
MRGQPAGPKNGVIGTYKRGYLDILGAHRDHVVGHGRQKLLFLVPRCPILRPCGVSQPISCVDTESG